MKQQVKVVLQCKTYISFLIHDSVKLVLQVVKIKKNEKEIEKETISRTRRKEDHIDGFITKPRIENFAKKLKHVCSFHVNVKTSYVVYKMNTTYEVFTLKWNEHTCFCFLGKFSIRGFVMKPSILCNLCQTQKF